LRFRIEQGVIWQKLLKLTERAIKGWADEQGYSNLLFAELDYRLLQTLDALYRNNFLAERLYMKGGTAINKLYLEKTSRLSVDLDFNHVGPKEQVLKERPDIRREIMKLLKKQDDSYVIHSSHRYEQTTIKSRYKTVIGPPQSFKIEISHVERFPILDSVQKQLATPDGQANVITYQIEELTATKLRAFFERLKGRDIYDLFFISRLELHPIITRKMFLYYFYRSRKVFNPKVHYGNLSKRYSSEKYVDDVSTFIKPTVTFSLKEAAQQVISYYSFLKELDDRDKDFLALAGLLLGRKVAKKSLAKVKKVQKPLKHLFKDLQISPEAREISKDEIRLFQRNKR